MTDYDYLLKTSEIYPLDNRKLCPWFNVDNYYLRGMKHMWPATRVFHRSFQIICIRHDLKGSLIRILQRTESRFSNDTWEAKRRFFINVKNNNSSRPGGGGRRLPYISYVGMCRPIAPLGRVFAPFWSEKGCTLRLFWSWIGYGFRGNYRSVWTYLSFQFQMSKTEREICTFEIDLKICFVCALISVMLT